MADSAQVEEVETDEMTDEMTDDGDQPRIHHLFEALAMAAADRAKQPKLTTLEDILAMFIPMTIPQLSDYGGKPHVVQCAQFMAYVKGAYPDKLRGEVEASMTGFDLCLNAALKAPATRRKV